MKTFFYVAAFIAAIVIAVPAGFLPTAALGYFILLLMFVGFIRLPNQ